MYCGLCNGGRISRAGCEMVLTALLFMGS